MHALYTGFYESIANLHGHAEFDYSLYGLNYPADVARDIYSPLQLHYGKEVG